MARSISRHHTFKNCFLVMTSIETITYETFEGSPYAGCWLTWHLDCPIDFGWELLQSAVYAAEYTAPQWCYSSAETRSGLLLHAAYLGSFFQIIANNSYAELSDLNLNEWKVLALPGENTVEVVGFVWKVGNNGSTFVALKQQYSQVIEIVTPHHKQINSHLIYALDIKSRHREGIK